MRDGDPSSSLDIKAPIGEWDRRRHAPIWERIDPGPADCRWPRGEWVDTRSGEVVGWVGCRRLACDACAVRYARGLVSAIQTVAQPERFVSLTLVPDPLREWVRLRAQLRDLARRLRLEGYSWEWAWFIERNPKGSGFHLHGLQHGDFVPQRELQGMWGGRIVDVRAIKSAGGAAAYGAKSAIGRVAHYGSKGIEGNPTEHRGLNGGRIGHWSRGFFRGEGVRAAMIAARGERPDSGAFLSLPILAERPGVIRRAS